MAQKRKEMLAGTGKLCKGVGERVYTRQVELQGVASSGPYNEIRVGERCRLAFTHKERWRGIRRKTKEGQKLGKPGWAHLWKDVGKQSEGER